MRHYFILSTNQLSLCVNNICKFLNPSRYLCHVNPLQLIASVCVCVFVNVRGIYKSSVRHAIPTSFLVIKSPLFTTIISGSLCRKPRQWQSQKQQLGMHKDILGFPVHLLKVKDCQLVCSSAVCLECHLICCDTIDNMYTSQRTVTIIVVIFIQCSKRDKLMNRKNTTKNSG